MTNSVAERRREEVVAAGGGEHVRHRRVFSPLSDIYESKDKLIVLADIPGVDESSIDITLEKNILTIQAFTIPQERAGLRLVYSECPEGNYRRVFMLSEEVEREGIEATVKNGVIKLILPKSPRALARKISVKAE
ncbi:MAG: Hsp20/alpha crystallin family protein [Cyanobacteria bacterium SZAS-4]|nr:Hsp20/alpha crystallin family protein [Cyanobacteria bacterium SZAS-4]